MKECINDGIYVSGLWDEFYVPQKQAYHKYNYIRNCLIYGYDDEIQCFESAGYIGENIWSLFKISYSDFLQSMIVDEDFVRFNTYIFNNNFNKTADIKRISNDIKDFLDSRQLIEESDYSFGIQANRDYFKNFIEFTTKAKIAVLQPLFALYEHKCLMYDRLNYLSLSGMASIPQDILKEYQKIPRIYRQLLNRAIKYNITKRKDVLEEITSIGSQCVELEEKLLNNINFASI